MRPKFFKSKPADKVEDEKEGEKKKVDPFGGIAPRDETAYQKKKEEEKQK